MYATGGSPTWVTVYTLSGGSWKVFGSAWEGQGGETLPARAFTVSKGGPVLISRYNPDTRETSQERYSPPAVWVPTSGAVVQPGKVARWSVPATAFGMNVSDAGYLAAAARQLGFTDVQAWPASSEPPGDWPPDDTDEARAHFQGTAPAGGPPIALPQGTIVWSWDFPMTGQSWVPVSSGKMRPGSTYRWSLLRAGPPGPPSAQVAQEFQGLGMWAPGQIPGDWPVDDLDPTRTRYQGTVPVGSAIFRIDDPTVRVWAWTYARSMPVA